MNTSVTSRRLARELGEWRTTAPAYRALAERIRMMAIDGRLGIGARLPAERELSAALSVSRTTVAGAYARLREDGFLHSVRGSGSVLALPRPDAPAAPAAAGAWRSAAVAGNFGPDQASVAAAAGSAGRRLPQGTAGSPGSAEPARLPLDFTKATLPAYPGLAAAFARAAEQIPGYLGHDGFDMVGLPDLREMIAQSYRDRGVPTSAGQIMVTIGAQHALHLVTRSLCAPGDRVLVEQPTYPHALDTFAAAGARLVGIPVHPDAGWNVEQAVLQIRRSVPSLAFVMPDFHNPTGLSMAVEERARLAAAAAREGTILVADETTALLDIDRGPLPPLAAFSPEVVTLGSLGKLAWGGLRIGWIRGPHALLGRLLRNRAAGDLGTPLFEQLVAAILLQELPAMVANRTALLRSGRDFLLGQLARELPEWTVAAPAGGLSLWINTGTISTSSLALAARGKGVGLVPGPRFGFDGAFERFLRLPFSGGADDLADGVRILASLTAAVDSVPLQLAQQSVI